jgi:hypothetical protein
MAIDNESFNRDLYDLLKVRGYRPTPLDSKNQRVPASQAADVIQFTFVKDGEEYGDAWVSIDDAQNVIVYYDEEQQESPSNNTPGVEYDDSWTGFLKHLKNWSQRRQLSFELANKDRLGDDMRQRDYYKMKEKLGEGYYPMGKKASYNDAVPSVKIILQHNRALEEGEQRYRNVAKIFLENQEGERFLAPTNKPGLARVYARHIAEGGVPNDDRWNHIKSICEDYSKMAGFVRATRKGQFNESAQELVNEGINHYNSLRETLHKLAGHRGYQNYFESWTPTLMEDELDESINELFVQEMVDPRIESAMPILSRLKKPVTEMSEIDTLAEWADSVINEKLELEEEEEKLDEVGSIPGDFMHSMTRPVRDLARKGGAKKALRKVVPGLGKREAGERAKDEQFHAALMKTSTPTYYDGEENPDHEKEVRSGKASEKAAKRYSNIAKGKKPFAEDEVEEGSGLENPKGHVYVGAKVYPKWDAKGEPFEVVRVIDDMTVLVKDDFGNTSEMYDRDLVPAAIEGLDLTKHKMSATEEDKQVEEDLDANQKRAGQLGPTEKVRNNNIGKLVGASESTEIDPELARIMEMARFKR